MNKKEIVQSIKIIVLGLVLALGASYVFAQPSGNVPGPLNVGSSSQSKAGSLAVGVGTPPTWPQYCTLWVIPMGGGSATCQSYSPSTAKLEVKGVAAIDALSVWSNAHITGNAAIGGNATITGNATIAGNAKISSLKFTSPANSAKQICVDNTGKLVYCP